MVTRRFNRDLGWLNCRLFPRQRLHLDHWLVLDGLWVRVLDSLLLNYLVRHRMDFRMLDYLMENLLDRGLRSKRLHNVLD